jgi:hypothetical protein
MSTQGYFISFSFCITYEKIGGKKVAPKGGGGGGYGPVTSLGRRIFAVPARDGGRRRDSLKLSSAVGASVTGGLPPHRLENCSMESVRQAIAMMRNENCEFSDPLFAGFPLLPGWNLFPSRCSLSLAGCCRGRNRSRLRAKRGSAEASQAGPPFPALAPCGTPPLCRCSDHAAEMLALD